MSMASSLPNKNTLLFIPILTLLVFLVPSSVSHLNKFPISYHDGPILTGNIDLVLVWYGPFGRAHKCVIRRFIKSLNCQLGPVIQPQVSSWWRMVESYQSLGKPGPGRYPPINVKVAKQIVDKSYSVGKILIADFIRPLVKQHAIGGKNSIVVIFAGRGVAVHGLCMGKCAIHGEIDSIPYIVVGEPETECPGACAWPFHPSDYAKGAVLKPPNGNIGADAMVIALASGLAETVTNPNNTAFYGGIPTRPVEAASACPEMFGTGATPGNAGKTLIDKATGGAFNAFGARGRKFLLPGLWDPKACACWTLM